MCTPLQAVCFFLLVCDWLLNVCSCIAESMMEPYLRFLYTYVSISGPHLGYLYSSNSLFNSGLWLLKKFKGTQCIHQLTFSDDPDLQNTFLYKLCKVLKGLQKEFCLPLKIFCISKHKLLKLVCYTLKTAKTFFLPSLIFLFLISA